MVSWLPQAALAFAVPPAVAYPMSLLPCRVAPSWPFTAWWLAEAAMGVAACVMSGWREAMPGAGASLAAALIAWWWSRRKGRKRAARLLGEKSRALRDKLVKNMPRWEPRLQGARA